MTNLQTKPLVMIDYHMEENGIFYVVFDGTIPYDSIISYLDDFYQLENLPKELNLLYDFTNVDFDLDPVKIKILSDKATAVTRNYTQIRTAFVVAGPRVTAYTILFSLMIPNEKSAREIFATIEAAEDWLLGNR